MVGARENISFSLRKMQQRFATRVTSVRELDLIRVLCRIVILMICKAGLFLVNIAFPHAIFRVHVEDLCIFVTVNV